MTLTKVGSMIPVSTAIDDVDPDPYEQAVRICASSGGQSRVITEMPNSLLKVLANYALFAIRVYVLVPPGVAFNRDDVGTFIKTQLPDLPWL